MRVRTCRECLCVSSPPALPFLLPSATGQGCPYREGSELERWLAGELPAPVCLRTMARVCGAMACAVAGDPEKCNPKQMGVMNTYISNFTAIMGNSS